MQAGKARLPPALQAPHQHGFTFIAVLLAMLLLSLATQGVMTSVSQQAQRERESDLLRIGQTYAQAIGAYYEASPGVVKRWPGRLEDLLEDTRQVSVKRYIREIYPDPVTRVADWVLLASDDGGIAGVRSQSQVAPIRSGSVDLGDKVLAPASRYADWQFVYQPAPVMPSNSAVNAPSPGRLP
jgi:type II secretory pathway pseudopilin PulG